MLITERKFGVFNIANIYFADKLNTIKVPDCDVETYHTIKKWDENNGFERIQSFTTTIDLSQSIDGIWNNINRQHKRHISRAEKNGTNVSVSNKFEEFYTFNKKFLKQKNYTDLIGINILSSEFMRKYGILFIAENQGEILGGSLYFHDENNAVPICCAYQLFEDSIDQKKRIYDVNCYIHWEAMKYFSSLDVFNYDFGGVNHFTISFKGNVVLRYQYRKFNSRFCKLLFHFWNFSQYRNDIEIDFTKSNEESMKVHNRES
jgi:hypothetical protein